MYLKFVKRIEVVKKINLWPVFGRYHKSQAIYLESKDNQKLSCVISSVGANEVGKAKCDKPAVWMSPRKYGVTCGLESKVSAFRQQLRIGKTPLKIFFFVDYNIRGFVFSLWYLWTPCTVIDLGTTSWTTGKNKRQVCVIPALRSYCIQILLNGTCLGSILHLRFVISLELSCVLLDCAVRR